MSFYADNAIDVHLSTEITRIEPATKSLIAGSRRVDYDHLILAMGASPRRLSAAVGGKLDGTDFIVID